MGMKNGLVEWLERGDVGLNKGERRMNVEPMSTETTFCWTYEDYKLSLAKPANPDVIGSQITPIPSSKVDLGGSSLIEKRCGHGATANDGSRFEPSLNGVANKLYNVK
jgi:hypothetical protein